MKCSICGGQISGREDICPTCGMRSTVGSVSVKPSDHVYVVPLRREKRRSPLPYLILVILIAAGFAALFFAVKLRQNEMYDQLIPEAETFVDSFADSFAGEEFLYSARGTTVNMIFHDTYLVVQSNDPDLVMSGQYAYSFTITMDKLEVSLIDAWNYMFNDEIMENYIDDFYIILTVNGSEYLVTIDRMYTDGYSIEISYEGYTLTGDID